MTGIEAFSYPEFLGSHDFDTYLAVTGGDVRRALGLFEWNVRVSAAFYELLGGVELVIRTAIDREMRSWSLRQGFGSNWFADRAGLLDERSRSDIARAVERIGTPLEQSDPDRIVSEVSFGFWRFLLTGRYRGSIWAQAIRHGFPHLPLQNSQRFSNQIGRLHDLRNRIAHHRPVHHRRLELDLRDCYAAVRAVSTEAEHWLQSRSRAEMLLAERP
jgi:hypothetical protein